MKDAIKIILGFAIFFTVVILIGSAIGCGEPEARLTTLDELRGQDIDTLVLQPAALKVIPGRDWLTDSVGAIEQYGFYLLNQDFTNTRETIISSDTLLAWLRDSISGDIQTLTYSNDSLYISGGNAIVITGFADTTEVNEVVDYINNLLAPAVQVNIDNISDLQDSIAAHRDAIEAIDVGSGTSHMTGSNLSIGTNAGASAAGTNGIFLGVSAGADAENKPYMIGIGYNAARYADVEDGIFIGRVSGLNATGGTDNTMVGSRSFENGNGDRNTAMGRDAFRDARVDNSVAFGYNAGQNVDSATGGTFIGHQSGSDSRGVDNTIVGNVSGRYIHGNNNTSIGARSFNYDTTSNIYHSTSIGAYTRVDKPNQMALGQDTLDELKIGETFRIKIDTTYANTGFGIGWNNSKGQFVPYNLVYISGQGMQVANNVISLGGDSSGSPTVINSRRYISTQSGAGSIILTGGGGILLAGAADRTAAGLIDAAGTVSAYKLQSTGLTSSYPRISTNTQSSSTVGYIDVARDDNTTNPRDLRFRRAQVEKFGIEGDLEAYDDMDMNSNDLFGVDVLTAATVNISSVIQLTPLADPPTPSEGMIYADTDNHLYYYDGTTWKQLDN